MRPDPFKPNKLVYSLINEESIGYIINPYVVQLDGRGNFTGIFQKINSQNLADFPAYETDFNKELVAICDEFSSTHIYKRFSKKKSNPKDFLKKFLKEKDARTYLDPYINNRLIKVLNLLKDQTICIAQKNDPTFLVAYIPKKELDISFNFERSENGTIYRLDAFEGRTKIHLSATNSQLISIDEPWLLVGKTLYHFNESVDGKKLKPFLTKESITVLSKNESAYYSTFVKQLSKSYKISAQGLGIKNTTNSPSLHLSFYRLRPNQLKVTAVYGEKSINLLSIGEQFLTISEDPFEVEFHHRNWALENEIAKEIEQLNCEFAQEGIYTLKDGSSFFDHLDRLNPIIEKYNLDVEFIGIDNHICLDIPDITINPTEKNDWFDLDIIVRFGIHEIKFIHLKEHILNRDQFFTLPDGSVGIIPESWFSTYGDLLSFGKFSGDSLSMKKFHQHLVPPSIASLLPPTDNSDPLELSKNLEKTLRPYQKDGFQWLSSLHSSAFSGILADDMGLGKTLQTIALLTSVHKKQDNKPSAQIDLFNFSDEQTGPSLIVMPATLIFNWVAELEKFSPKMSVYIHYGPNRMENKALLRHYNLVLSTYGLVRNDKNFLSATEWEYIVLDESQQIKNPKALITKKLSTYKSKFRLALTGTPMENSLMDLWSQMNFLNPELLGSSAFFQSYFQTPIEKQNVEEKKEELQRLINPFVLRRTKENVATELPPLTEQVVYLEMTKSQADLYEEVKSKYRNLIIESGGVTKNRFLVLKGLLELRQIANHPTLYDEESEADSGKFEEIKDKLVDLIKAKRRILMFSQFTKHLDIYEKLLKKNGTRYSRLTGATRDRKKVVDQFTSDSKCSVFLISLKAGGVGLNLTSADYVFILDPWWNPAIEAQAVDRAHRIGQENKVFIYKFITQNSVEEKILALQQQKIALSQDLITTESSFVKTLSKNDIADILK